MKSIKKILKEEIQNYMFFQNLKTIKSHVDMLLDKSPEELDSIISNGHDWAAEHITTAKDDIEEVCDFFTHGKNVMDEGKKKGLWDNIHAKRKRGEKPAKPGDEDYPNKKSWDKVTKEEEEVIQEAEHQGRKVTLNKPTRCGKDEKGCSKKFKVFVQDGDKVKKVQFGDPNMEIKKDNPKNRKSFRARHNCDNPGPKTKARYWSCKKW